MSFKNLLHYAVYHRKNDIVKLLITKGNADVNAVDEVKLLNNHF